MFNLKRLLSATLIASHLLFCATVANANGAGILPYARDQRGNIFFLVSEDKHRRDVWTDFGGSGQADIDTASKEGHEETMGVFTGHYRHPYGWRRKGYAAIKKQLRSNTKRMATSKGDYATYLLDITDSVKHQNGKVNIIRHLHSTLRMLQNQKQSLRKKKQRTRLTQYESDKLKRLKCFTEKRNFLWISKRDFLDSIDNDTAIGNRHTGGDKPLYILFRNTLLRRENRAMIENLR